MLTEVAAFVPVAALVICTPGPDTALTVRNTLTGGRKGGVLTAAGVAIGQGVWTVAASMGLTGLLRASAPAFLAMKAIGAAYLVFLGIQSLGLGHHPGLGPLDAPGQGGVTEQRHPVGLHPQSLSSKGRVSSPNRRDGLG